MELEDECCDNGIQEELERGTGERYNHNTLYNGAKLLRIKHGFLLLLVFNI